jgi:hypothetical protein
MENESKAEEKKRFRIGRHCEKCKADDWREAFRVSIGDTSATLCDPCADEWTDFVNGNEVYLDTLRAEAGKTGIVAGMCGGMGYEIEELTEAWLAVDKARHALGLLARQWLGRTPPI